MKKLLESPQRVIESNFRNHKVENAPEKLPLILFSGGLDSTYLLQTKLQESDVYTVYVSSSQGPNKIDQELKARKAIIEELEKNSRHRVIEDYVVTLGNQLNAEGRVDWKFRQPSLWIMGVLQVVCSHRHSELLMGYVAGDQILSHLHDIENAWKSLQAFSRESVVPISFPLRYTRKTDILSHLNSNVYKHLWICEMPVKPNKRSTKLEACGKCDACLTHYGALQIWEKRNGYPYGSAPEKEELELTSSNP